MLRSIGSFLNSRKNKSKRRTTSVRHVGRLERLEPRQLMVGTVNVLVPGDGTLTLVGDGSNNQVELRQTIVGGFNNTYEISSPDDTDFQLNGSGQSLASITVNFINGDITANLGDGNDTFRFFGIAGGGKSDVPADLNINNADGSNLNELLDLFVHGDLSVTKNGASSGYSELTLTNSTVIGDTVVNNVGVGTGDSMTTIDNSILQAGGPLQFGLSLTNGSGKDILSVQGNSQFGTGSFPGLQPLISINNGAGGSRTTFTGASDVAGPGTTTVYGDVLIDNGLNSPTKLDIVTFNTVNVLGSVTVNNSDGTTQTMVLSSTLGSHLAPNLGGPLTINNGSGHDQLTITGTNLPYGLVVDNDVVAGGASNFGSTTAITTSRIGSHPNGPMLPGTKDVLIFSGDNGNDTFALNAAVLGGGLNLTNLFNGSNEIQIINQSIVPSLVIVGGAENDRVILNDSSFLISVDIRLNAGSDTLQVIDVDPATEWPSPLLGRLVLDGGLGMDFSNLDALTLGAIGFEVRI